MIGRLNMKYTLISFILIIFSTASVNASIQCTELLKSQILEATEVRQTKGDLAFADEQLKIIKDENVQLEELAETVDLHLKVLAKNQKLRNAKGGFSRILEARRTMEIAKLHAALRDGPRAIGRVWGVVRQTMIRTEFNAVMLNVKQRRLVQLNTRLEEVKFYHIFDRHRTKEDIYWLEKEIETSIKKLHKDYTLYRAFRATFETQMTHGRNELERNFAAKAFSETGLQNSSLLIKLPESLDFQEGERPSVDFIRAEYAAADFADGTHRYLRGRGLYYKLKLENRELLKLKYWSWVEHAGVHKIVDALAQSVRKHSNNKIMTAFASALDWIVKDLQNREAIKSHLAELESINTVHPSRQLRRFQIVRSNFMNSSVFFRSKEFDFLTSFARAQEYQRLWKRIHFTLALRNVNASGLVDKLIAKERVLDVKNAELDLIQSEINSKGDNLNVDDSLLKQEAKLITSKANAEKALTAIQTSIREKIAEFLKLEGDTVAQVGLPQLHKDLSLYKDMVKANERATAMGPLSYEFSPGTGARFTAWTVAAIVGGRWLLIETGGIKYVDQALGVFGLKIPEWDALIGTFEPFMQVIGNGNSGIL